MSPPSAGPQLPPTLYRLSPDLRPLLTSAYLIGIPNSAGSIPPIAIGLTLRRLSGGKVVVHLLSEETSTYLQPQQLGVGVPRSVEAIVQLVHCYFSHHSAFGDHLLEKVYLSNTCNCVLREAILHAVLAVCPVTLPWVAYTEL